jgi:hypothetical protein
MASFPACELLESRAVEQAQRVGFDEDPFELVRRQRRREVEDRPGRARAGDAQADEPVAFGDLPPMDDDPPRRLPRPRGVLTCGVTAASANLQRAAAGRSLSSEPAPQASTAASQS